MTSDLHADYGAVANRLGKASLSTTPRSLKRKNEENERRSVGGRSERKRRLAWMKKILISSGRPIPSLSSELLAR
jgi:hypothetical protein